MNKLFLILFTLTSCSTFAQPIDRAAVVRRHTIHINKADSLSSLSIGNGKFAFTADITGLQSFPGFYAGGVPLGTQSSWGWHSFPNKDNYRFEESLKTYEFEGRQIPYSVQWKEPERNKNASDYFRQNPHRLQLGNVGLEITKKNGQLAEISDIQNIQQQLDLYTGELESRFTVEEEQVYVLTACHQQQDAIAVRIESRLIDAQRLKIRIHIPYPAGTWKDVGNTFTNAGSYTSTYTSYTNGGKINCKIDATQFEIGLKWNGRATLQEKQPHYFLVVPTAGGSFDLTCRFTPGAVKQPIPSLLQTVLSTRSTWTAFWKSGGAIDFTGSTDKRAMELERRIILSQYLTRLQCSNEFPPQETGLTYNSWFGKPHLEMHWWHAVHFALWGRPELMEKSLNWYFTVADSAKAIARRQGFEGLRWQKMVDHEGGESPSSVGSFLIWQQPHFIYMAELLYRHKKNASVLNKYKDLVFATADFMASYPSYNKETQKYNLGRGLIPAQECFDAVKTFNPTYELAYWHWALSVAQQWRERSGLSRNKKWDEIISNLAPLPQKDDVYLATESTPDCYTNEAFLVDHPAVLGAYSTIPAAHGLDTSIMKNTFDLVWKIWRWNNTWGWDFPLTAMTATRLGLPEKAIGALLMPIRTNTYLVNGHNFQDERLTIYLPGNGGLLSAIAMMCAGYDGSGNTPGFPTDGSWRVKWEGLKKIY